MTENDLQKRYRKYYCKSPLMVWLEGRGSSSDIASQYSLSFNGSAVQSQLTFRYPLNYKNSFVKLIRENEQDTGYLSEGLIATYPVSVLQKQYVKYVSKVLPAELMRLKFKPSDKHPAVQTFDIRELDHSTGVAGLVTVYFPYYDSSAADKAAREFSEYAHAVGYDLSDHAVVDFDGKLTDENGKSVNIIQLTYEAKFNRKEFILPNWLYHVTTFAAAQKILKRGFIPRSDNKTYSYQDRTYLFASLKPIDIIVAILSKDILKDRDQQFVMLRVSKDALQASSLYKTGKMEFYVDPKYDMLSGMPTAVYTHNNISPNLIDSECVTFQINNLKIVNVKQQKTSTISKKEEVQQ